MPPLIHPNLSNENIPDRNLNQWPKTKPKKTKQISPMNAIATAILILFVRPTTIFLLIITLLWIIL
jgi:hypothetical protein